MTTKNTVAAPVGEQTIYLPRGGLKGCLRIAPKSDIRYFLNGVHVEADRNGTTLAATDGHRLLAVRSSTENAISEPVSFIIPREVALHAVTGGSVAMRRSPVAVKKQEGGRWSIHLAQMTGRAWLEFAPVDGRFPDWRRVIPQEISNTCGHYNPRYIADFAAAAADTFGTTAMRGPAIKICQNADRAAIVLSTVASAEEFFGILMSVADPKIAWQLPAWAATPESEPSKEGQTA